MRAIPSAVPSPARRFESLDGLRGLAAAVVVVFHLMLVSPKLAQAELETRRSADLVGLLTTTPLKLLWAGDEAVLVFFVLSGLVLGIGFRHRAADWIEYYPRRLVRLYVPVWGSILLALAWRAAVPRVAVPGDSWWMAIHDFDLSIRGIGGDATLVIGTTVTNSVLWSLKWEVWFSLLLPVYLLVLARGRRLWAVKAVALLAVVQVGTATNDDALRYLPVFGLGVLVATHLDDLRALTARLPPAVSRLIVATALLVLIARWLVASPIPLTAVAAIGATGLVVAVATGMPGTALLAARPMLWLGRISFSLYLVHEPVVVSAALLLGNLPPVLVVAITLVVAVALAAAFYAIVERPAHRLSRYVGKRASAVVEGLRRPAPQADPL